MSLWPLLHASELAEAADVCAGCGSRARKTSSTGRRWCYGCWWAAADEAAGGAA